jgi:hypothetical protein
MMTSVATSQIFERKPCDPTQLKLKKLETQNATMREKKRKKTPK